MNIGLKRGRNAEFQQNDTRTNKTEDGICSSVASHKPIELKNKITCFLPNLKMKKSLRIQMRSKTPLHIQHIHKLSFSETKQRVFRPKPKVSGTISNILYGARKNNYCESPTMSINQYFLLNKAQRRMPSLFTSKVDYKKSKPSQENTPLAGTLFKKLMGMMRENYKSSFLHSATKGYKVNILSPQSRNTQHNFHPLELTFKSNYPEIRSIHPINLSYSDPAKKIFSNEILSKLMG